MSFADLEPVTRIVVVGALAYIALVGMLRISGKRTLSKLNAFDLVVTVAIGSTLATTMLSPDVSLVSGVTAFALLVILQFVVTWSSTRFRFVDRLVKAEPTVLFLRGEFLEGAMRRERIVRTEVVAAARSAGVADLDAVTAVVLETDGSLSVISGDGRAEASTLPPRGETRRSEGARQAPP